MKYLVIAIISRPY